MNEYCRIKCPICGKRFHPESLHIYRAGTRMVCSYHCQRQWEKSQKESPAEKRRRETIEKELAGGFGINRSI